MFVSHSVMKDRGSTCKFQKALRTLPNFHVDPIFYTTMRNKQVEFNPYENSKITYRLHVHIATAMRATMRMKTPPPTAAPVTTCATLSDCILASKNVKIFTRHCIILKVKESNFTCNFIFEDSLDRTQRRGRTFHSV